MGGTTKQSNHTKPSRARHRLPLHAMASDQHPVGTLAVVRKAVFSCDSCVSWFLRGAPSCRHQPHSFASIRQPPPDCKQRGTEGREVEWLFHCAVRASVVYDTRGVNRHGQQGKTRRSRPLARVAAPRGNHLTTKKRISYDDGSRTVPRGRVQSGQRSHRLRGLGGLRHPVPTNPLRSRFECPRQTLGPPTRN